LTRETISEREPRLIEEKARMVRTDFVRLTGVAGSGHYGSAFSIAELAHRPVAYDTCDRRHLNPEEGQ
jgi:transketolase N-terminal domain/subunit